MFKNGGYLVSIILSFFFNNYVSEVLPVSSFLELISVTAPGLILELMF